MAEPAATVSEASSLLQLPSQLQTRIEFQSRTMWRCDVCGKRHFDTKEAATQHEELCRRQQQKTVSVTQSPQPVVVEVEEQQQHNSSRRQEPPPPVKKKPRQRTLAPIFCKPPKATSSSRDAASLRERQQLRKALELSRAMVGMPADTASIPFFLSRKKQRHSTQHSSNHNPNNNDNDCDTNNESTTSNTSKTQTLEEVARRDPHVFFPTPSHVLPIDTATDTATLSNEATGKVSYSSRKPSPQDITIPLNYDDWKPHQRRPPPPPGPLQPQLRLLDQLFVSNNHHTIPPTLPSPLSIQSIPDDIVGAARKDTATQMLEWVQRFMVQRQKAHASRRSKQESLRRHGHHTPKRQRSYEYYTDDDDLWDDHHHDSWDDASMVLLLGPTGSGKTALVHAVARQLNCRVVEMNASQDRSGVLLKKATEETTRSDSAIDMIQSQQQQQQQHKKGKRRITTTTTGLWNNSAKSTKQTTDSTTTTSSSSVDTTRASVSIVLLDQVDFIREDCGDQGFWAALRSLAVRSKSPIVLTANTLPAPLDAGGPLHRLCHVHAWPNPTLMDAVLWTRQQQLQQWGLTMRPHLSAMQKRVLMQDFCRLCQCDLRRMNNYLSIYTIQGRSEGKMTSWACDESVDNDKCDADDCVVVTKDGGGTMTDTRTVQRDQQLQQALRQATLQSDAVYMDQYAMGLPAMEGASRGFCKCLLKPQKESVTFGTGGSEDAKNHTHPDDSANDNDHEESTTDMSCTVVCTKKCKPCGLERTLQQETLADPGYHHGSANALLSVPFGKERRRLDAASHGHDKESEIATAIRTMTNLPSCHVVDNGLLEQQRYDTLQNKTDLLWETLEDSTPRAVLRTYAGGPDDLPQDCLDSALLLDYLPHLSSMAHTSMERTMLLDDVSEGHANGQDESLDNGSRYSSRTRRSTRVQTYSSCMPPVLAALPRDIVQDIGKARLVVTESQATTD